MPEIEVVLPKMGESVAEATITTWLKEEGDTIEMDEPIVEIATDKVDSEVPAPQEGILVKRLCEEGDVMKVGDPIAIIRTEGEDSSPVTESGSKSAEPTPQKETTSAPKTPAPASNGSHRPEPVGAEANVEISRTGPSGRFYSPLVRNIAKEEGITMHALEQISGSGAGGRVTKKDLLEFIPQYKADPAQTAPTNGHEKPVAKQAPNLERAATPAPKPSSISLMPGDEIMEMDRMRKIIAEHMVMSKHTSPHVTSYVEADVTNLVMWRNQHKKKFEEREGEKLTFTPLFIEALVKAMKDMPGVNVSVDGDKIIRRKHFNIGMAAALPSGNLIVPVIKDADQLNLVGLAAKVNDLANRARNNKLLPDEIQGGTYTLTNVGTFGNVMGTPIINQPQCAVMAVGAIRKKPAVIETPQGDTIGIRHMMFLSHSYDHRVIDGALGGMFVRRVADYLEQFDINREI